MAETAEVKEAPKVETAVAETPSPAPPEGTIIADKPKEATGFRRYNQDKGEFETLTEDVGDERAAPPKEETKTEEVKAESAKAEEPPKLLAGKYKTTDELEKAYKELERSYHEKNQERTKEEKAAVAETAKPAAEQVVKEAKAPGYVDLLLDDPTGAKFEEALFRRADERAQTHAQTQQMRQEWEKVNPDLKGMEHLVRTELQEILASHPDKAKGDLKLLLEEATGSFRARLAPVIAQAKQEALTIRSTVQPLGLSSETRKEETQTPAEKGATTDPVAEEIAARRQHNARVTGRIPAR